MELQQPVGGAGNAYGYVPATAVITGRHGTNVMTSANMNHWAPLFQPLIHPKNVLSALSLHMQAEVMEEHSG